MPLTVDHLYSTFYDDKALFPEGTIAFDNALLMRNIEHGWIVQDQET